MSTVVQKVGGLEVLSYGKIVVDPRYCKRIASKVHVYPAGFCTRRRGAGKGGKGEATFTSSIVEGADGPEFTVEIDDEPGVIHRAHSATAVWSAVLGARRDTEAAESSREVANGTLKFGYGIDAVAVEIQKMPGYDALVALVPKAPSKAVEGVSADAAVVEQAKPAPKKASAASRKKEEPTPLPATDLPAPPTDGTKPKAKRVPKKNAGNESAIAPCAECGLTSQYCPMSGALHALWVRPCSLCNLLSVYCSQTGQRHAPMHQPLHGIAATPAPAAPTAAPAVVARSGPKKRGENLAAPPPPAGGSPSVVEGGGGDGTVVGISDAKPVAKKRRTEKQPKDGATQMLAEVRTSGDLTQPIGAGDAIVEPTTPSLPPKQGRKRQRTLSEMSSKPPGDHFAAAAAEVPKAEPLPPPPPPPPKPFVYPPLKAVASKLDHTIFKTQVLPSDAAIKARMEASGATTAVAQKRYFSFVAAYTSEKTIQEAVKANKAASSKAPDAADISSGIADTAAAHNVDDATNTAVALPRGGSKRAGSSRAPKAQSRGASASAVEA